MIHSSVKYALVKMSALQAVYAVVKMSALQAVYVVVKMPALQAVEFGSNFCQNLPNLFDGIYKFLVWSTVIEVMCRVKD